MEAITEGGIIAFIVAIVLGLFKFLDRIWPNKQGAMIVECPNKIEGLSSTMTNINRTLEKIEDDTSSTRSYSEHLVSQHAPEGGVEQWKIPKQMVPLLETSVKQGENIIRLLEMIAERRSEPR